MKHDVKRIFTGRILKIFLRDDSILEVEVNSDEEFDACDMQEVIRAAEELGKGKRLLHLMKFGARTIATKEARLLSSSEFGSRFRLADALIVNSLAQRMIFNYMINVEKPVVPTRLFSNEQEAIHWLNSMKEL